MLQLQSPKGNPALSYRPFPIRHRAIQPLFNHYCSGLSCLQLQNQQDFSQSLGAHQILRGTYETLHQYINPQSDQARNAVIAHYERERRNHVGDSFKTVMCQNWLLTASCGFGKFCRFAHGEHELRPPKLPLIPNRNYKTKLCEKYKKGICPFGQNCLFIHPDEFNSTLPPAASNNASIFTEPAEQSFPHAATLQLTNNYSANFLQLEEQEFKDHSAHSPPEIYSFSSSLPAVPNGSSVSISMTTNNTTQPIARPNKNLFPQIQREMKMERREDKKKSVHDLLKRQDQIFASAERRRIQRSHTQSTPPQKTPPQISTTTPQASKNISPSQRSYDPFAANIETYVSTISHVLDNSDIPG